MIASSIDFEFDKTTGTIIGYKGVNKDVIIPEQIDGITVKIIGNSSFEEKDITSLVIPNGVIEIGGAAFNGNKLTSLELPTSVITIGASAFGSNRLVSVTLTDCVTTIGNFAFHGNYITAITIPESVIEVGLCAFGNNEITKIVVKGNETRFNSNWGYICFPLDKSLMPGEQIETDTYFFDKETGTIIKYYGSDGNLVIPSEIDGVAVRVIGYNAFSFKNLESVEIPHGVSVIGYNAFYGNKLNEVTIPDSVVYLGEDAFRYNELTSIVIPNSITTIDEGVFANNKIEIAVLPSKLEIISEDMFSSNKLTNIIIPSGVRVIGNSAFYDNVLTSVKIPDSVNMIGESAFNSNQLSNVTIKGCKGRFNEVWKFIGFPLDLFLMSPDCVKTDKYIFDKVTGTIIDYAGSDMNIVIPDMIDNLEVKVIGATAFENKKLTNVKLPKSLVRIGNKAFNENMLTHVTIPSRVTVIDEGAFWDNDLKQVVIEYNNANKKDRFGLTLYDYTFDYIDINKIKYKITEK